MNGTYLVHHGIKGQRWGIRRYQNEDGTLTEAGKRRYYTNSKGEVEKLPSGREINKEYDAAKKKATTTPEYKEYESKVNRIIEESEALVEKYGLDGDDGGGGDTTKWSEKELNAASRKYWELAEQWQTYEDKLYETQREYAGKAIADKYGKYGVQKMENYNNSVAAAAVAAIIAVPVGAALLLGKRG